MWVSYLFPFFIAVNIIIQIWILSERMAWSNNMTGKHLSRPEVCKFQSEENWSTDENQFLVIKNDKYVYMCVVKLSLEKEWEYQWSTLKREERLQNNSSKQAYQEQAWYRGALLLWHGCPKGKHYIQLKNKLHPWLFPYPLKQPVVSLSTPTKQKNYNKIKMNKIADATKFGNVFATLNNLLMLGLADSLKQ